jgi:hypothetical protein
MFGPLVWAWLYAFFNTSSAAAAATGGASRAIRTAFGRGGYLSLCAGLQVLVWVVMRSIPASELFVDGKEKEEKDKSAVPTL